MNRLIRQVWHSGNVVGHIYEVTPRLAGLVLRTEMGGRSRVYYLGIQPSHPGQLSLVIPPWVGEMSSLLAMVKATAREFCENSRPVTRTVGMLTYNWLDEVLAAITEPAIRPTCMLA